ncbi:GGDEF domain-containing protein [Clostridium grantii]|uniref:Diguanylate cyclase n=1 Tax=Clostridium grantii DSM 8605 TaxID=1121316 RepID=A0A1M5V6E8_9CLOT|nr:diguanylate cyclase [Clostridium grantii]SHH70795.1 diguanylate cyclase [Clostridium grantii DSM 8605]
MWKDLFTNACILITILSISSQIITNKKNSIIFNLKTKILLGILGGFTTIILIEFSIHITPKVVMDSRHITQILLAIFGGFVPTIIAGLLSAVFRLIYLGVTLTSTIASIGIFTVSVGLGLISKFNINFKLKWITMTVYSLTIYSIIISVIYDNTRNLLSILLIYWVISIIVTITIYYLIQYFTKVYNLFQNLKKESSKDFLTGLNNTRQFDLAYNSLQNIVSNEKRVSLLILDIDHFKNINDTYGHVAGDEVLKEMSLVLLKSCEENYFVSRIGGEEFTVIIKDLPMNEILAISERIRINMEKHLFSIPKNKHLQITVSIGVAMYPDTVDNTKNLKEVADIKLYEAKRSGRNKICF